MPATLYRVGRGCVTLKSYSSAFISRVFVVMAVVVAVIAGVTTVTLMLLMDQTNRGAVGDQRQRLEMAVADELTRAKLELATVMSGRSARYGAETAATDAGGLPDRFRQAWSYFGFNSVYAIDPGGAVVAGSEFGSPAGTSGYAPLASLVAHLLRDAYRARGSEAGRNAAKLVSPGYERELSRAALVHDGHGLAVAVAMPLNPQNRPQEGGDVVVALRTFTSLSLREIGLRHGLGAIRFSSRIDRNHDHSLPVHAADGSVVGALVWKPARPGSALLPQLMIVAVVSLLAVVGAFLFLFRRLRALAADLAQEEDRARRMASHDYLSGLLNKMSFNARVEEEIARCERDGSGFALMLVDLDKFKDVNDTLGHRAGDEVIREVARRISDTVRGADVVARLGGDEFAVIQVQTETTLEAGALAGRIREALRKPIRIGGAEVHIGCSIGIALAPVSGKNVAGLIELADSALYEAKNDGRNRHRFFESSIDQSMKMKQLVEEELRDAIANDQLELHYQPQVSADGARIVGVEALVRWRHPVRGMIPPLEFISLAEERGLIVPLSEWVLRRACEDGKRWDGLTVAINVSAAQFKQPRFVEDLVATVEEVGFDLTRLELELTEGMIVEDEAKAEDAIFALRGHGIKMALDDFGTGYSSLIYLRRFSFDKIKIDRSFLESMESTGESAILVHSVVHLGRALGLTVCAEGVETEEQSRFLQAVGCHQLQGYVFSRPLPAADFEALLKRAEPFAAAA